MVAHLTRLLGPAHLDLAEETVQEAMLRALQTWPYQGVPENAAAWLFRVAHNVAIDAVRRNRAAGREDGCDRRRTVALGSVRAGRSGCGGTTSRR